MDKGLVVGLTVGNFVLLLCNGKACVIRMMRDLILLFSKSSIYSKKPQKNRRIERNNLNIRTNIKLLIRRTICFLKSEVTYVDNMEC